jgi:hypothetical protein
MNRNERAHRREIELLKVRAMHAQAEANLVTATLAHEQAMASRRERAELTNALGNHTLAAIAAVNELHAHLDTWRNR